MLRNTESAVADCLRFELITEGARANVDIIQRSTARAIFAYTHEVFTKHCYHDMEIFMKNAEYKTESLQAIIDAIVVYCNSQKGAHQSALTDINDEDYFQYLADAFNKGNIPADAWAVYTSARNEKIKRKKLADTTAASARDEIARCNKEVDKKRATSSESLSPDAQLDESMPSVASCESFMANPELTDAQRQDITLYAIAYHCVKRIIGSPLIKTKLCCAYQDAFLLKYMIICREKKIFSDAQLGCAPSVMFIAESDLVESIKKSLEELFSFKFQNTVIENGLDTICEAKNHMSSSNDGLSNRTPTESTEKKVSTQPCVSDSKIDDLINSIVKLGNDESAEDSHDELVQVSSAVISANQADNSSGHASRTSEVLSLTPAKSDDSSDNWCSQEDFEKQFIRNIVKAIDTSPPNESIQNIFRKVSSVEESDWGVLHRFLSSQEGEEHAIGYLKKNNQSQKIKSMLVQPPVHVVKSKLTKSPDWAPACQQQTRPLISRYYVTAILLSCALVFGVIAAALIIPPCLVSLVGAQAMVDTGISLLATSCGGLVAAGGSALVTHYTDGHKADV